MEIVLTNGDFSDAPGLVMLLAADDRLVIRCTPGTIPGFALEVHAGLDAKRTTATVKLIRAQAKDAMSGCFECDFAL
jgi:hypothetical protein